MAVMALGCNDGGGDGDDAGAPPPMGTLQFFQSGLPDDDARQLGALVPSSPTYLMQVEAGMVADGPFHVARANVSAGTLTDVATDSLLFLDDEGVFRRVPASFDGGTPEARRVSSASGLEEICRFLVAQDYKDPDNARLAYVSGDRNCSGIGGAAVLDWRLIAVGDDTAAAPREFPGEPVRALSDPGNGAHTGWLVLQDGVLKRVDADLHVQADSLAEVAEGVGRSVFLPEQGLVNGSVFVNVDSVLHLFDPARNALSSLGYRFDGATGASGVSGMGRAATDGEELYFIYDGALRRTDVASQTTMVLDVPEDPPKSGTAGTGLLQIGADYVGWVYNDTDDNIVVRSSAKNGDGGIELDRYDPTEALWSFSGLPELGSARLGAWMYYTRPTPDSWDGLSAVAARLDGTQTRVFRGARWVTANTATTRPVAGAAPMVERVVLLDGVAALDDSNSVLKSFPVDNPAGPGVEIGALPADIDQMNAIARSPNLLRATSSSGLIALDYDLIFYDTNQPGSLQRVTDTDDLNETPVATAP